MTRAPMMSRPSFAPAVAAAVPVMMLRAGGLLVAAALLAMAAPARSAPAADSAYATDPQQTWVSDKTAEPIRQVNNVMCYVASMRPDALVNQGPYAALVDGAKCEGSSSSGSSTNTGVKYKRVIVDSSRATSADPMRGKVWVPMDGSDGTGDIFVNLSASQAPSAANPNGVFRLDYCAPMPGGGCFMNGRLEGLTSGLRYIETERQSNAGGAPATLRVFVARDGDNGAGAIASDVPGSPSDSVTYRFAYDANYFRRVKAGGEDACFDRRLANGKSSAFRYGLYDANGARIDRQGGFPVTAQVNGRTEHGYAGYFGLQFQGSAGSAVTDGATLTRERFDNSAAAPETYTLNKVAGRLLKYQRQLLPLDKARNLPISVNIWNGVTNATAALLASGATQNTMRGRQLEMSWDAQRGRFIATGLVVCDSSGCNSTPLATPVELSNADYALYTFGMNGFSQSLGGEVALPGSLVNLLAAGQTPPVDASLVVRVSDVVYPGSADAPPALYCVNNCTGATGLSQLAAGTAQDPFEGTRDSMTNVASTVTYTFGANGRLMKGAGEVLWPDSLTAQQAGNFGQGVRTGKLLTAAADFACPSDATKFCSTRADDAPVYYMWETGPNAWNQFAGLRGADGQFLKFDAPLPVSYNVPSRAEFGAFAGSTLRLQYNGFGDLFGIPSNCVNAVTNAPTACVPGQEVRWVPAFTIPDTLTDGVVTDADGRSYLVKWLNREVRFAEVAGAQCSALVPGSLADLPTASGLVNPADPADSLYIGAKPTVTAAPRVVDGMVKY